MPRHSDAQLPPVGRACCLAGAATSPSKCRASFAHAHRTLRGCGDARRNAAPPDGGQVCAFASACRRFCRNCHSKQARAWAGRLSAAASLQLGPAQAARRAALRRGAAGFCCARERVASFTLTLQRTCVNLCLCLCFEGMRLGMSISPRQLPRARREIHFDCNWYPLFI
jgi:hypothetical protein